MEQRVIGDPGELQPPLVIVDALRLIGKIAAGQHDRLLDAFEQQMVERGVGQHKAECALAGRHCRSNSFALLCRQHDNRRRRAAQQPLFLRRHCAIASHNVEIAGHQRKGHVKAVLAGTQPFYSLGIAGIAGEVKAADALYGDDRAIEQ